MLALTDGCRRAITPRPSTHTMINKAFYGFVSGVGVCTVFLYFVLGRSGPVALQTFSAHGWITRSNDARWNGSQMTPAFSTGGTVSDAELSIILGNVKRCLNASDLLEFLQQKGLLQEAFKSATLYFKRVRELVPQTSLTPFPSHCWNVDVERQVIRSKRTIRGRYGSVKFSFRGTVINSEYELMLKHWSRHSTRDLLGVVCMPQVFLAGFFKCGSTFLFEQIVSHPLVVSPRIKEPKWWQRTSHFDGSISQRAFFLVEYLMNYKSLVKQSQSLDTRAEHLLSIDASPGMMFNWLNFSAFSYRTESKINHCLLPSVVPEILPQSKFIVVMRNPTDMVYSAFWYSCATYPKVPKEILLRKGPNIFHSRVLQKIMKFKECIGDFHLAHCVLDTLAQSIYSQEVHCGRSPLDMALYYVHIHKWLSVVPRDRFLFLTLEELASNTERTMANVWEFLNLPAHRIPPVLSRKPVNHQWRFDYRRDPRLAMRTETKQLLDNFFAPYNLMLADLLKDKRFLWENSS